MLRMWPSWLCPINFPGTCEHTAGSTGSLFCWLNSHNCNFNIKFSSQEQAPWQLPHPRLPGFWYVVRGSSSSHVEVVLPLSLILMPWVARSWRRASHASNKGCLSWSCCLRASPVAPGVASAYWRTFSLKRTSSSTTQCRAAVPLSPETHC